MFSTDCPLSSDHLNCRHDRTGEVAAAYGLRYGLKNWKQVNALNYEIGIPLFRSLIQFPNQRALVWYCYHLQFEKGYENLDCKVVSTNNHNKRKPSMINWDESQSSEALLTSVIVLAVVTGFVLVIVCVMLSCLLFCWRKQRRMQFQVLKYEEEMESEL